MAAKEYTGGKLFVAENATRVPSPSTGYDVKASKLNDKRREIALSRANAILHNGQEYITFFCPDTEIDFGLSGSMGQGPYVRDFYPHNVEIPSVRIMGECLDQDDYATVIEFIRDGQRKGVRNHTLTQITIKGGGLAVPHPIMKGDHNPLVAQGYIKQVDRHHERFVYKPEFVFEFVLAHMLQGLYREVSTEEPAGRTMVQILAAMKEADTKPVATPERAIIKKVAVEVAKDITLAENFLKEGF